LLLLAEVNGDLAGTGWAWSISPLEQMALLALGIGLVVWGLGDGSRRWVAPLPIGEITLVGALTLVALLVRFWDLGESVRVFVDESHFAFGVHAFRRLDGVPLLAPMPTSASFPYIYAYGEYHMTALLGRDLLGLRALSALVGALTVPALYLLARHLYDRVTAVVAALLLVTFPPHLHFSRLALNNIADPLFGTLGLGLLARAIHTQRRRDYALGGAMIGLTSYFYEGGRLLFPLLAITWLAAGLVLRGPGARRPTGRGMLVAALAFVLVAMPVYLTLVGLDFPLINRLDSTRLDDAYFATHDEPDTLRTRWYHLRHALLFLVNQPENTRVYYYLYYGGHDPLLLPWLVPVFLLGVVIAAWRWRGPGVLPLVWVAAALAGNMALIESTVSARYVVVFPALVLLAAVGARRTLALVIESARARGVILVALAGAALVGQGAYYFGPFLERFSVEVLERRDYVIEDAIFRAEELPPGTQIFVVAENVLPEGDARQLLHLLYGEDYSLAVHTPYSFSQINLRNLPRDVPLAFFLMPRDDRSRRRVQDVFGGPGPPQFSPYEDVPDDKELALYVVPPLE
ncbi:MAG: phospholipid carrier-dependent glycosyltransferase, partial [Chloroflexi bacterium]|nr:phospholipid carrier-dependent glycosyltransferase [Chloroflexota bacterium]